MPTRDAIYFRSIQEDTLELLEIDVKEVEIEYVSKNVERNREPGRGSFNSALMRAGWRFFLQIL